MRNTLMHGDRVFISLLGNKLKQGDIVVIQADKAVTLKDDGTLLAADGLHITIVKRIIACEGQTVDIDFSSGAVYVDGERLFEDYVTLGLTHLDEGAFTEKYPVTVPKGYVFVMGDYRSASKDSRSEEIGFVSEDSITGKVLFRFFPNFESLE